MKMNEYEIQADRYKLSVLHGSQELYNSQSYNS